MSRAVLLVPAALGIVLALVTLLAGPGVRLVVATAPAVPLAVGGVGLSALLLVLAGRRRRAAAAATARTAAAVAEAERSRRRFVGRLDHELKNPLTALLTALSAPEATAGDRAVARAQAERIRRLLADLRRLADVETAELDRTPIDVPALLREAVESVAADDPAAATRRIRLDVPQAPWPLPPVAGDADLLLVAVYNVLANAVKFTGPGDVVEVRAREGSGPVPTVVLEVADTGPGIPPDEQHLVWEELARASTARSVPGSGVGLALVRLILHRHGGTVALRSRPGRGTSVLLELPARPGP